MDEMKKYIIELPESTHWIQWIMESTKDHHPYMDYKQVEDLTPFTEPNLDAIRKEAYEKGLFDGKNQDAKDFADMYDSGYSEGLKDAWEAARTLWNMPNRKEIFGYTAFNTTITTLTAQETIEKIRQYEQEKEEFHVGDEFKNESGKRFVILKMDGEEIDRYIDEEGKTYCMSQKYKVMRKTSRHFPEIAEVLRKMREDTDG